MSTGVDLVRYVQSKMVSNGVLRIERPNDEEVLRFLGFQRSLRSQMLSRTRKPSFLTLSLDGDELIGKWYGLLVTKDTKASLKELVQPGSSKVKIFRFRRSE